MNTKNINNDIKRVGKIYSILKFGVIFTVLIIFFLLVSSIFTTEQDVYSLNKYLSEKYLYFMVLRVVTYSIIFVICFKIRSRIKAKSKYHYKSFKFTCLVSSVFIIFNEIMLYIRLIGG